MGPNNSHCQSPGLTEERVHLTGNVTLTGIRTVQPTVDPGVRSKRPESRDEEERSEEISRLEMEVDEALRGLK